MSWTYSSINQSASHNSVITVILDLWNLRLVCVLLTSKPFRRLPRALAPPFSWLNKQNNVSSYRKFVSTTVMWLLHCGQPPFMSAIIVTAATRTLHLPNTMDTIWRWSSFWREYKKLYCILPVSCAFTELYAKQPLSLRFPSRRRVFSARQHRRHKEPFNYLYIVPVCGSGMQKMLPYYYIFIWLGWSLPYLK